MHAVVLLTTQITQLIITTTFLTLSAIALINTYYVTKVW
jgi:hypothetical protein